MTRKQLAALATIALTSATVLVVRRQARRAEARYPPTGKFLDVDGVRLHYLERGSGPPVVLLHGNGVMARDFEGSAVLDRLAENHRVIAFDRPGYGFSERPRTRRWTPEAQAELLNTACQPLGIERPVVMGHSWGTLVAVAWALQRPDEVRGLLLLSGYYYPSLRADVVLFAPPAIPVLGDLIRNTIGSVVARLLMPALLRQMFGPLPVPDRFRQAVPPSLMVRPWQLRASAAEAALMIPAAARLRKRYAELRMPVKLLAGAADRVADVNRHSGRLHREVPGSGLCVVDGAGHMVHYVAQNSIVESVAALSGPQATTVQRSG